MDIYSATEIRGAVAKLQEAVVNPRTDEFVTSEAHTTVRDARSSAPTIVATWIDQYLQRLATARSRQDVTAAIADLAQCFKLGPSLAPAFAYEQGRLFECTE